MADEKHVRFLDIKVTTADDDGVSVVVVVVVVVDVVDVVVNFVVPCSRYFERIPHISQIK